jgi:shikimate kinase
VSDDAGAIERVVLIGGPGAGKSIVGAALAGRMGWRHIDLDAYIEWRAGRPVREIVEADGIAEFRRWEARATQELAGRRVVVLTPGGGWALNPALPQRLAPGARFVWLRAQVATVLCRLAAADIEARPLLAGPDPAAALARLFVERAPIYESLADLVVDVDGRTVEETADLLESLLRPRLAADRANS